MSCGYNDYELILIKSDEDKLTKQELFKLPLGTIITTDKEKNNRFVKVGDDDFCNNDCSHIHSDNVNEDLSLIDYHCFYGSKILKIEVPTSFDITEIKDEIKEMTVKEIEEALGYPVKIIKE